MITTTMHANWRKYGYRYFCRLVDETGSKLRRVFTQMPLSRLLFMSGIFDFSMKFRSLLQLLVRFNICELLNRVGPFVNLSYGNNVWLLVRVIVALYYLL